MPLTYDLLAVAHTKLNMLTPALWGFSMLFIDAVFCISGVFWNVGFSTHTTGVLSPRSVVFLTSNFFHLQGTVVRVPRFILKGFHWNLWVHKECVKPGLGYLE